MREEPIDAPLQKIYVLFEGGKVFSPPRPPEGAIRPVALLWGQRRYRVARVNSDWVDRSLCSPPPSPPRGRRWPIRYGFSLTVDTGEIFQLSYEEGNPVWRLDYILTE